jgi:hypothetical protein
VTMSTIVAAATSDAVSAIDAPNGTRIL